MAAAVIPDPDVAAVLAHGHDNGADFRATEDGRIYVGNPFSTISSLCLLHEPGVRADHEGVRVPDALRFLPEPRENLAS